MGRMSWIAMYHWDPRVSGTHAAGSARHGDGKEGGRGCATANRTRIRL